MPNVRLTRREVHEGWLPDLCAITGQPTEERVTRRFDTLGWLLFLFPMLIFVRAAGCKSVTIDLPVVPELHDYWLRRTLPSLALLTTTTSISIGGFVLIGSDEFQMVGAVTALTGTVLAIASYFHWMFMWEKGVRVSYISDRWVKLNNVHPAFVAAVNDLRDEREARRQPGEEEDDAEREARWRRRRRERDAEPPITARPFALRPPIE
jgi:hypothetical protein